MFSKVTKSSPILFSLLSRTGRSKAPAMSLRALESKTYPVHAIKLHYNSGFAFSTDPKRDPLDSKTTNKNENAAKSNTKANSTNANINNTADATSKGNVADSNTESKRDLKDQINTFTEFMQNQGEAAQVDYTYDDKEIFSIMSQYENFKARQRGDSLMILLMLGASAISYFYIHPYVVVLPLWFLIGSVASLNGARRLSKSLCKSMELLNSSNVKLKIISGKEIIARIEDIEILGIKEWSPISMKNSENNNYLVMANVKDVNGKNFKQIRFIVDSHLTTIDNIDLFRAVLHADVKEVEKYKFVEKVVETVEEEEDPENVKPKFDFSAEEMETLKGELKTPSQEKPGEKKD